MLTKLSIKNYALIDDLTIGFESGFTTITGETGAGKSILLGALSMVLGKRADLSSLKNKDKKCTIEAEFLVVDYGLESFFEENDLDYEQHAILSREILPSGKSRAFINDTPASLNIVKALGSRLVDIHSQHQTLMLTQNSFQLRVIDALAQNESLVYQFKLELDKYNAIKKKWNELILNKDQAEKELDYNQFLLSELEKAPLQKNILEDLEAEYEQLNNVEGLMDTLSNAYQLLNDEQAGILPSIAQLNQLTQKLQSFGSTYETYYERFQSIAIELADLASEIESLSESVEPNPNRLEVVNEQLQLLHNLFKKHQVDSTEELISIRETLAQKVAVSLNMEEAIKELKIKITQKKVLLQKIGQKISNRRKNAIPKLKTQLSALISELGMPSASFKIELKALDTYTQNGIDELNFQFSANKGSDYGELKKVASGGELSRIMLAIKAILASYEKLPTLIFDEIDTGVSGEISNKMGQIMLKMGEHMQLFSITHLPQVASKGYQQLKVFKSETQGVTSTQIKPLTQVERIHELAEMLGGKNFTESAVLHAKELLTQQ